MQEKYLLACSEPRQTSWMQHFAKNVNCLKLLTIFEKGSILDIERILGMFLWPLLRKT